jgi:hypothetical protein
MTAHAAACPVCAGRAAVLRGRRARLSALLADADGPVPDLAVPDLAVPDVLLGRPPVVRRPPARHATAGRSVWRPASGRPALGRPAARIAAAAVLVVGATLAAQPAREWVAARWRGLTGRAPAADARPGADAARPAAHRPRRRAAERCVVTFTPAPGPFTIAFDARPTGGTLTVIAVAGAQASATHPAGRRPPADAAADLLVLPAASACGTRRPRRRTTRCACRPPRAAWRCGSPGARAPRPTRASTSSAAGR